MINGVTDLIITKVDILSDMEEIKYYSNDVGYKTIKSWDSDKLTSDIYIFLPEELKYFLNVIRLELETEIKMLSIGPNRDDIIYL
jgi:adenylosuccinate synthase